MQSSTSAVFESKVFQQFLTYLRERFDLIFIDSVPLNLVLDAVIVGRAADVSLLVSRVGYVDKSTVKQAVEQIRFADLRVSGSILNFTSGRRRGANGYYDYGYGDQDRAAAAASYTEVKSSDPSSPTTRDPVHSSR